jgi:UDP-3-O-[3-hydroxymyristoyl] N-acetylglucosamine deacetylase
VFSIYVKVLKQCQIPSLDGSAQEWVEAIQSVGLCAAEDANGKKLDKLVPEIHEPVYLRRDDCFIAAFPSSQIHITYGIDFPKVYSFLPFEISKKLVRCGYETGSCLMTSDAL